MRVIRLILIIYSCLVILGAFILFQQTKSIWSFFLVAYLLVNTFIIIMASLFEKGRYKSKSVLREGWQPTGERFIDQTSGKTMEVYYNSKTGERDYREVIS